MPRLAFGLRSCWLLAAAVAVLSGCSAVVEPDLGELGPRPAPCQPGSLEQFTCADSAIVSRICGDQGAFPAAVCPSASCEPTTTWPCRCADGTVATRFCLPQSVWATCPCGPAPAAGAPGG